LAALQHWDPIGFDRALQHQTSIFGSLKFRPWFPCG
jgi:hypothetical protein